MEDETSVPASSSSTGTTSESDSGASGPRAVASLPDKLKMVGKIGNVGRKLGNIMRKLGKIVRKLGSV